jgi:hypothetical protein
LSFDVEQVAPAFFEVSTTIGTYYPETWASGQFQILVMSKDRVFYRIKPAFRDYLTVDHNAYQSVRNQGNSYYNPGNCF